MNWADEERGRAEPRFNQIFVLPIAWGVQCSPPTLDWFRLGRREQGFTSFSPRLLTTVRSWFRVAVRGHTGLLLRYMIVSDHSLPLRMVSQLEQAEERKEEHPSWSYRERDNDLIS